MHDPPAGLCSLYSRVWFRGWWPGGVCTQNMCTQKMWQHPHSAPEAAVAEVAGWCLGHSGCGAPTRAGGSVGIIRDGKPSRPGSWACVKMPCTAKHPWYVPFLLKLRVSYRFRDSTILGHYKVCRMVIAVGYGYEAVEKQVGDKWSHMEPPAKVGDYKVLNLSVKNYSLGKSDNVSYQSKSTHTSGHPNKSQWRIPWGSLRHHHLNQSTHPQAHVQ